MTPQSWALVYNTSIMIRLIEGVVASSSGNQVVLETSHGIGYLVAVPSSVFATPGERIRLFTHLAVRETALDLYGFTTTDDLTLFELLLTLSGIGPKSAMQILDQASRSLILEAISLEDALHLTKHSGIGKKTAEKIILGLKDKVPMTAISGTAPRTDSAYQDAFDTLITLGYNPQSVREVLANSEAETSTSALVARALKELS